MPQNMNIEQLAAQTDVDKTVDCPLCMEALDYDDLGFYPCSCGYQVCRFCWHRLKNDESGLCPACRQAYPDSPIQFASISIEAVEELKKRKKKQKEKQKLNNAKSQNLLSIRVVQKNLLFVIGLSPRLTQDDLRREFAKYGKIMKMVINSSSAYVTYTRAEDAVAAIKSLNDGYVNKNGVRTAMPTLRASLGTTKYCTHWLRCQACPKQPDCMYLHEMADQEASFTKEEMQLGKHTEYEKRLIHHYLELIAREKERKKQDNNRHHNGANKNKVMLITNGGGGADVSGKSGGGGKSKSNKANGNQCNNKRKSNNNINGGSNRNHCAVESALNGGSNRDVTCESMTSTKDSHTGLTPTVNTSTISSTAKTIATSVSSSPTPFRWGSIGSHSRHTTSSSNSESTSNSLSSTPNATTISSAPQTIMINGGCDLMANIDDNAMDTTIGQTEQEGHTNGLICIINNDNSREDDDITADDDGLDFDPISISSRGLQDLLRDSSLVSSDSDVSCNNRYASSQPQQYMSKAIVNSVPHQCPPPQASHPIHWQQQHQNSLRQLLPNVNITFQRQSSPITAIPTIATTVHSNSFATAFPNASQSLANNHIRQQQRQTIAHPLQTISGQLMGHPIISPSSAAVSNVNMNGSVGCGVSQYQNWTPSAQQSSAHQQQQQHILRYQHQQQQQQQQMQRQQYNSNFYLGSLCSLSRQPPPGF